MTAIWRSVSALCAFGALGISAFAEDSFPPDRALAECSPRAGLPNFFAKLEKGGEVKVAYLGGSITAQNGWRVKSLAFFQKLYPNAKLKEINAAIGGTGSDLGVLRIEHDVFRGRPDLLFVEFAVNDFIAKPENIAKCMEGIVRKTWRTLPDCDICFVYTLTGNPGLLNDLKAGKFNRSAAVMEVVADRYRIPSVHMGLEVVRLEKEGKLIMKAPEGRMTRVSGDELNQSAGVKSMVSPDGLIRFAPDGVHPFADTGHQLYQEAIERSIPLIKAASSAPAPHGILPDPLDPGNYENTVMLSVDKAQMSGPWTALAAKDKITGHFLNRADSFWKGEPGAALSFKFKGSAASIYHIFGPDCGRLEITVDGKTSYVNCIDSYCSYWRLALLKLGSNLDPEKVHEVAVKVLPDKLEKAGILSKENRLDLEKNPAKYDGANWYCGAIFIAGELASQN